MTRRIPSKALPLELNFPTEAILVPVNAALRVNPLKMSHYSSSNCLKCEKPPEAIVHHLVKLQKTQSSQT